MNVKSTSRRQLPFQLRVVWLGAVCFLMLQSPGQAQNFDMGYTGQSAGQGYAPADAALARSNVQFSDFGTINTPNLNPQYSAISPSRNPIPADLLPINQQNVTTDGLTINSTSAQETFAAGGLTGTNYSQAPTLDPVAGDIGRNVNGFLPGAANPTHTTLQPTTTALQAPNSLYGNTVLPSGSGHFQHLNYGFSGSAVPEIYNGSYGHNNVLTPLPTGSGFRLPAFLPPVSLGSVEVNVAAGEPR